MKKIIKKLIGNDLFYFFKDIKYKYFSGGEKAIMDEKEAEAMPKRRKLYGSFLAKNDLCFDVGANIGNRITPLLDIGARVVAIEPQESCYSFLKYKYGKKIEIVTKGLGEQAGIKEFHLSNAPELSTFSEEWLSSVKDERFKNYKWDEVVRVEMTTLDQLIEQYGIPAFIKIDVEGYELEVLKGLTRPIKMISFEFTVPEHVNRIFDCIEQIEKNDPNISFNYCKGEDMEFVLPKWLSKEQMKDHIHSDQFQPIGFGDIYVRLNSSF